MSSEHYRQISCKYYGWLNVVNCSPISGDFFCLSGASILLFDDWFPRQPSYTQVIVPVRVFIVWVINGIYLHMRING